MKKQTAHLSLLKKLLPLALILTLLTLPALAEEMSAEIPEEAGASATEAYAQASEEIPAEADAEMKAAAATETVADAEAEPDPACTGSEGVAAETTEAAASGTCGDHLTWSLNVTTGVLTISGSGTMTELTASDSALWYNSKPSVKSIVISNGVMNICENAFYGCVNLTTVSIPITVRTIGRCAFYGCSSLKTIGIPNGVSTIEDSAFCNCTKLPDITIPASVTSIGSGAFKNCVSMTAINVSEDNTCYSSASGVLFNKDQTKLLACPGGKAGRYNVPKTVTVIDTDAFRGCENLTSVRFANNGGKLKELGTGVFANCDSLKAIAIPDTVTTIGQYAFGIWGNNEVKSDFTAYVFSGSAAETYCKKYGVHYVLRDRSVTGLTASAGSDSLVTLRWSGISGAAGYIVYRGTSSDGSDLSEITTTSSTSYIDRSIALVGTYYYVVVPYWMAGDERISGKFTSMTVVTVKYVPADKSPFTDVQDKTLYYYQPVLWAVKKGITSGTTATTFSPDESCTRGQIVTFLWRAAGSPTVSATNPFKDVSSSDYCYQAVLWAVKNGITSGTSNTTFSPNSTCTRGQVVAFMYRAAGSPSITASNPFQDVKTNDYYYRAVLWAVKNGITSGTSAGVFSPGSPCTRAQVVTFLYRNAS